MKFPIYRHCFGGYLHWYGAEEAIETGYTCPVCGVDVEWWREPYDVDENGCVCHENCLRDTEDEQWETV